MADPIDCKDKVASKRTLAGAVAREIERIVQAGGIGTEGLAYKAFHDGRGSDYTKHVYAAYCDSTRINCDVRLIAGGVINIHALAGPVVH